MQPKFGLQGYFALSKEFDQAKLEILYEVQLIYLLGQYALTHNKN